MTMNKNSQPVLIMKSDAEEQRMVWAEVYAPNRPDVDNEFMTAETIRKMAHDFARSLKLQQVDVQHDNEVVDQVVIVETFIARKGDPDFIEGSWVVGVHVNDDELWQAIKEGKINGFSVEALVTKETREVEIEIPEVVVGKTSQEEDHVHEFTVNYGPNLEYLGGKTNVVNGHMHVIKAGTVTEIADGHRHRFSSVDNVEIISG